MVKVDLPPPETPVMQVKVPTGISAVTSFRLLPRAPMTRSTFFFEIGRRSSGTAISRAPERYWPVRLRGLAMMSAGLPSAITSPPWAAGGRAHVDHVVGREDRLFVVLHHQHRIAEVPQALQRGQQAGVVALVQPD